MRYVKICPRCGHANDELSEICEKDGEFLGMTPAQPEPAAPKPSPEPAPASAPCAEVAAHFGADVCVTQRFNDGAPALYLEVPATGQCFEVHDGWMLGQAHPGSDANIQLRDVPGLNYVHRRHCRFEVREGSWHVVAVAQSDYTNPTLVNQQRMAPGQNAALKNGDRLTLSNVTLTVRILEL